MALFIRSNEDRVDDFSVRLFSGTVAGSGFMVNIDDLDEIDKRTVYVNELTESSNNPSVNNKVDRNRPLEVLGTKDNFNHLAISFGIRYFIK